MSEDDEFESAAQPVVVQPTTTEFSVDTHKDHVCKMIEQTLMKHLDGIANRKYETKVTVTSSGSNDPLKMNVNIETNDPRVIAALAASGGAK